jgi:serine/threonine-protein kinase HipA
MKIAPGTPLRMSLHWDKDDIQPVGRLAYRDHIAYLEYDEGFQSAGLELSPVHHRVGSGLQKPYQTSVFDGLHGVFNDSLPDGWGRLLIDRRARQLGIEPATLTPLDRLACVGSGGIGALCYAPETDIWQEPDGQRDLDKLAQDARRVLDGEVSDVLSILGKVGGSPGGARPKALIAVGEGGHTVHCTDDVPAGYAHYLVKFQGHGDPEDIAAIEMAYAVMARDAGIEMPETRLLRGAAGKLHFAARRFDREGGRRVHVHSASGLLYSDIRIPALDYKDLILLTRAATRDQRQCRATYTLAVFNVLAHNRDDHARQFSYIMERDGSWRLAPAYDLTWASGPGGEHSTSVLGYGRDVTRKHLIELAKKADVKPQEAAEIIERVQDAVAKWPALAREYGVGEESARMIEKSLVEVRV